MVRTVIQELSEQDINLAFSEDLFFMEYQPEVALNSQHEITGAEAFVRMQHQNYGVMMPGSFLPLIASMDLMFELTCTVLRQVAQDWLAFNQKGLDLNISVNIDKDILSKDNLAQELGVILAESAIPKRRITLEFSNLLSNKNLSADARNILMRLRVKGYRISMDDFKSEGLDEEYFSDLPLDEIKIDRVVSNGLLDSEVNQGIAKNGLYLANRFGYRIVAVGIEDESTTAWYQSMGFDIGQGYLFGKPMSQKAFYHEYIRSGKHTIAKETQASILVIEDDVEYQSLLFESLSEFYTVKMASSIKQAKEMLNGFTPNIILLDVYLPDGTGIDFCKNELQNESMSACNIIFISGAKEFDNKLQAYEVGGSDYIEKPFSIVELVAKIRRISNYQSRRQELLNNASEANQMALQSMKDAAYYGEIVQFLKRLMSCHDELQISSELFRFMAQKSLMTSIEFRTGTGLSHFDQLANVCNPIELNIFDLLRDKGRLYSFGQRLMVNDVHVSFLVKNMPADAEEQGKIRDYVAVLIEGMESRYQEILRQRVLATVTNRLENLANKLIDIVDAQSKSKNELLEKYSFELQMSFHSLDLSEEQERHISTIIEEMLKSKEVDDINIASLNEEIVGMLNIMKQSQEELDKSKQENAQDDPFDSTVDLF